MTKTLKFLLGLFVVAFLVMLLIAALCYFISDEIPTWIKWVEAILLVLIIACFPAITLSEARRTKGQEKRWVKENGVWKIKKD